MSVIRLPLLCAFAGGCLSSAVLFGFWKADTAAGAPARKQLAGNGELVAANRRQPQDEVLAHATHVASPAAQPEAASVAATDRERDAKGDVPAPRDTQDPTPSGSAVSDILTDLEAAYRQRLIAAARAEAAQAAEASAAPEHPPSPAALATTAIAQVERPSAGSAPVAASAAPVAPPVLPAVAAVAPAAIAPAAVAPPASEPKGAPAPAVVAQNDVRPPDVHFGDINQNTYNITNVRQGDVYVMQQVAMMQYMQLLGMSSAAGHVAPAHGVRAALSQPQQYRQFPSTLTNPDNPWGFNFAPPNLVH